MSYRFEAALTKEEFLGDKGSERLTDFTVSGEGETPQEAMANCIAKMAALGHDPRSITDIGLLSAEEVARRFIRKYDDLSNVCVVDRDAHVAAAIAAVFAEAGLPLREAQS